MLTLLADVVWPALLLEGRLLAWWVIAIGLLIEWPFVRFLTDFPWRKSFIVDAAMNAASTVLGIILLPVAGIAWEYFAHATFSTPVSTCTHSIPSLGRPRFSSPSRLVLLSSCWYCGSRLSGD